jgi:ATP-dependent Lon protease
MEQIALFPLKIVLFPDSSYPLHIFEPRYKSLMKAHLESGKKFGIILQTASVRFDIGCIANIAKILKTYEDGRMDIVVTGYERFKSYNIKMAPDGCLRADIDVFKDREEIPNRSMVAKSVELFNNIAASVESLNIAPVKQDDFHNEYASFHIVQKAGLSLNERQKFLELDSENKRLEKLIHHFERVLPMVERAEQVNKIIKNDGYYTN